MGVHLINHVDKGLGIFPTEGLQHFNLVAVREDGRDHGDAFACSKFPVDQTFPRWSAAAREKPVRLVMRDPEWKLTSLVRFAILPILVGASEGLDPSIVESKPISCP